MPQESLKGYSDLGLFLPFFLAPPALPICLLNYFCFKINKNKTSSDMSFLDVLVPDFWHVIELSSSGEWNAFWMWFGAFSENPASYAAKNKCQGLSPAITQGLISWQERFQFFSAGIHSTCYIWLSKVKWWSQVGFKGQRHHAWRWNPK